MRMPADRRLVQAEGRDQPAAAALAGRAERGVVAFSSGNHARGVAIAARRLGIRAIIVMPADAPQVKIEGTRGEGAEIVFYDRRTESREAIAARIAGETRCDRRAELRRSDDRRRPGDSGAGDRRAARALAGRGLSFPAAAAGSRRGSRSQFRMRRSWWSSLKAGTTWAVRSIRARSCRWPRTRPDTFCDAIQTPRVSPITFGDPERPERARGVGQRWRGRPTQSASPGRSTSW